MVEVSEERLSEVMEAYEAAGIDAVDIGRVTDDGKVTIYLCRPRELLKKMLRAADMSG